MYRGTWVSGNGRFIYQSTPHGCRMVTSQAPTVEGLLVRFPTKPLAVPAASEVGHGNRP
jgi:hypothetical protein